MKKGLMLLIGAAFLLVSAAAAFGQSGESVEDAIVMTLNEVTIVDYGRIGTERFLKITAEQDGTFYITSHDKFNYKRGGRAPSFANYTDISTDPGFENLIELGQKPGGKYYGSDGYDAGALAAPLWFSWPVRAGVTYYIRLDNDGADSRGGRGQVYISDQVINSWPW